MTDVTDIIFIRYKNSTSPMARISIEFESARDRRGYRLVDNGQPKMLRIVRIGTGIGPENLVPCRPLGSTELLFEIFANMAATPEGALNFVTRYGPLTADGEDAQRGDAVNLIIFNAELMQAILSARAGKQRSPAIMGRQHHGSPKPLVVDPHDTGPSVPLNAMLVWNPVTKSRDWEFRPFTLLDGLWLQLAQAVSAGGQMRQCEHCGAWFEAGRGTGRRLDAKFCCDEHRVTFNSLKRSREK